MRALLIALLHPLRTDFSHLIERLEDIRIERFMSHRPIESFNEGVLIGLARLNKPENDPTIRTPGRKAIGVQGPDAKVLFHVREPKESQFSKKLQLGRFAISTKNGIDS
jgi:hypothetical protein